MSKKKSTRRTSKPKTVDATIPIMQWIQDETLVGKLIESDPNTKDAVEWASSVLRNSAKTGYPITRSEELFRHATPNHARLLRELEGRIGETMGESA